MSTASGTILEQSIILALSPVPHKVQEEQQATPSYSTEQRVVNCRVIKVVALGHDAGIGDAAWEVSGNGDICQQNIPYADPIRVLGLHTGVNRSCTRVNALSDCAVNEFTIGLGVSHSADGF